MLPRSNGGCLTICLAAVSLTIPVLAFAAGSSSNRPAPPGVKAVEAPGLHNVFTLGTIVISGSSPEGPQSFETLSALGVKTIITVDGAKPNVELARQFGMRYVHLPHGYDGIRPNLQLQLAKAGQSLPGPIYVHCHHGKHRGPTAAAILCMASNGWTPEQAETWLSVAGTATNYTGLYATVRRFKQPSPAQLSELSAEFVETAPVSGLIEAMVNVDERWEHLRAVQAAGYRPPKEHPDIDPADEAVILWEQYREAQRLPDAARHGMDFIERLEHAEIQAKEAERLLRIFGTEPQRAVREQLDRTFTAMGKSCATCHKSYRD